MSVNLEYKRIFNASLDAMYAKEIQDIYTSYLDSNSYDLSKALKKFHQKLETLKFKSAPLAICILNVFYGLSSQTRNNLDQQVIKEIREMTLIIFNIFKHSILNDDMTSNKDEEIIGETDDFERILYLTFETCFNIAHDGIKYRKSKDIFNIGVTLMARILGALGRNQVGEHFTKYELRYDQLENSINDSGTDVEKLKECLKLLKKRYITHSKEEQVQIEKDLIEYKFNFY